MSLKFYGFLIALAFITFIVVSAIRTEISSTDAKEQTAWDIVVERDGLEFALTHNYVVRMNPGVPPGRYIIPLDVIPEMDMYLISPEALSYVRTDYLQWIESETKMKAIDTVPNDTLWGDQWGPAKINGPAAWDTQTGDPSVLIAVVDTGINYNHPDLAANYVPGGLDHVNDDADPNDDHSHGSHVAGTIAAVTNNSQGVAGMCWDCGLVAEKVLSQFGSGSSFDVAQGILHAGHDLGVDIINMSLGGGFSLTIENAVDHVYNNHQVLVVSACGNGGAGPSDCSFPAAHTNSMAISCSTQTDGLCSFSQRGPSVDVSAPGSGIVSTVLGSGYAFFSGTSMSTPHVAGVAALAKSENPGIGVDELWGLLQLTAADVVSTNSDVWEPTHGFGRVDAGAAVVSASSPPAGRLPKPDAEPTPTPTPSGPTNTPGPTPTPSDTPTVTPTNTPGPTPTCPAPRTPTRRERTPTPCPGGPPGTPTVTPTPPEPPATALPSVTPVEPTTTPLPLPCEVRIRIDGVEQWLPKPFAFCQED